MLAGGISALLLPVAFVLRRLTWDALSGGPAGKPSRGEGGAQSGAAPSDQGGREGDVQSGEEGDGAPLQIGRLTLAKLWLMLFCGSGPGLLCHGHAAAILYAAAAGGASVTALGPLGVSAMATGSILGRLGGGMLIDRVPARRCLIGLPLLTAGALRRRGRRNGRARRNRRNRCNRAQPFPTADTRH